MRKTIVLTIFGTLSLGFCWMAKADTLNLFPPPPLTLGDASQGQDIGDFGVGVVFDAVNSFSITDAAIQFNPFAGTTKDILAVVYSVTKNSDNNGTGDINFTPAGCNPNNPNTIPGNCNAIAGTNAPTGLANSAITPIVDNGQQFYDTLLNFNFVAGNRYALEFFANSDINSFGWGTGAGAQNLMTLWEWDPSNPADKPFTVGPSGSLGAVSVVDGAYIGDGGILNKNFPAIQLSGAVPEPRMVGVLLGAIALLLFPMLRKRLGKTTA